MKAFFPLESIIAIVLNKKSIISFTHLKELNAAFSKDSSFDFRKLGQLAPFEFVPHQICRS